MKKAAFLDRDGVINETLRNGNTPLPPRTIEEVLILEGVVEAIELLKTHDYLPIVISNQPDVARGTIIKSQVESINEKIRRETGVHHFYICYHDDGDDCPCRKPKTGLLLNAIEELNIEVSKSFLVGDRWRDIEAGQKAGVESYFIDSSYNEKQPNQPFRRVYSLLEAVQLALGA